MSDRPGYASVFLVKGERAAILDCGVSVNAGTILDGVEAAGVALTDVAFIAPTHAHYDHAGGAHELLHRLRESGNDKVKVACSIKPSVYLSRADILVKLMKSGLATEGEMAGEMKPIDKDDFLVLEDGDELDLGGIKLRAIDTPGHANGHLAFLAPEIDFIFVGDACGMLGRGKGAELVIAPTAFAPEYRQETYLNTVREIAAMGVGLAGFGHFGTIEDPAPALMAAVDLAEWLHALVEEMVAGKRERDEILALMEDRMAEAMISLYKDRERVRLSFKSMIAGIKNDLLR